MFKLIALPFKTLRGAVRIAGVRNSLLLLAGVGIGLLIAPSTGATTRARLRHRIESARAKRTAGLAADPAPSL